MKSITSVVLLFLMTMFMTWLFVTWSYGSFWLIYGSTWNWKLYFGLISVLEGFWILSLTISAYSKKDDE